MQKLNSVPFPQKRGEVSFSPSSAAVLENSSFEPRFEDIETDHVEVVPESRIVFHSDPRSPGADRFRYLRMRLRELWDAGKLRSVLITSPLPQDGKSTIALNLATVLAEHGKRTVLLIEADLHHPTLSSQFALPARKGLAESLENGLNPLSFVRRLEPLGWYLLPSGHTERNPTDLLQPGALVHVMSKLSPHFDWIIFDAPPLGPLTDAVSLSRVADASLVVARAGHTPREGVEETFKLLGPKHVLGVVLNGMDGLDKVYSKYRAYYGKSTPPTK
jgi:succinoglycan biosynthesis transport protein ExoP